MDLTPALEITQRLRADARTDWELGDDALERGSVVRVADEPQQREDVLDLLALVEARAADELVGDRGADECFLDRTALPVGAIEHGDVAPTIAEFVLQTAQLVDHEARFYRLVERLANDDRLAGLVGGAQTAVDA